FEIHALEVPGAAEHATALRYPHPVHRPPGREGHVDAGIPHPGCTDGGAQTVAAAVQGRQGSARERAGERLDVHGVREEEARVAVAERGNAELEARAAGLERAEVGDLVSHSIVVHVERTGDAGLPQRGVGVRQVELVDVLAELPLKAALLPLAEQVRFFEAEEPAETRALADGG